MRFLAKQVQWSPGGKWEGPGTAWKRRGIPFLRLCRLKGRELVDWNCCWSRTGFWDDDCGEWKTKRAKPPYGLIAST
jgi:hypothetical protein